MEFYAEIPEKLCAALAPCERCKTRILIVDGYPERYPPGKKLPEWFDRRREVA